MTAPLPPDATQFLAQFTGRHTFQTFDDREPKAPTLSRILHDARALCALNTQGAGVFLMVNEGDGQGREKTNVTRIRAYPADFDGAPLPDVWPLEPSLTVESSPGRFHAYWVLDDAEPAPLENAAFNAQVEAIARAVGSEPNDCKGLNRVMRVPGFLHRKGASFCTRLLSVTGRRYTLAQIQTAFPLPVRPSPAVDRPTAPRRAPEPAGLDRRSEVRRTYALKALDGLADELRATGEGERNTTLNALSYRAGRLVGGGHLDRAEVEDELTRAALDAGLNAAEALGTLSSGLEAGLKDPDGLEQVGLDVSKSGRRKGGDGDEDEESGSKRPPASTRVLEYAQEDGAEFWHDQGGNAFLTVTTQGHREHYRLPSRAARDYVQALYYTREKRALNGQAQSEALGLMQAIARREGREYRTAVRVAHFGGFTHLDLGTATWEAVEIGPGYWKVVPPHECPVRFTRPNGFLPLPTPQQGGDLRELGEFLNTDQRGLIMCAAWLVTAASGLSPFPVLALSGEQGTGKSTAASVLRNLLDPNQADRRRSPKEERDLFIAAQASHVLSFDNLSSIPAWLSDALCVLSTGGAFTARTLYSDSEETILEAVRPVIVNGIPDLLARPDLAERSLTVTLHRIPPNKRAPERVFWVRYERARGRLLGAVCDALAHGLRHLEGTELENAPRMADFARLIVACEPRLPWEAGAFLAEYGQMQSEAAVSVLDGEPVADALRRLMDEQGEWTGTVKKLLGILGEREYPDSRPPQHWPKSPRGLGGMLRRLAPALSQIGYGVTALGRSREGDRYHLSKSTESTFTTCTTYTEAVPDGVLKGEHLPSNVHTAPGNVHTVPQGVNIEAQPVNIEGGDVHREKSVLDGLSERCERGEHSIPSFRDAAGWEGEAL